MAKRFLWLHETGELVNEFTIGYMINSTLHVNKVFKEKVEKCMNDTFGSLTQPFMKKIMTKKTYVLELLMFHDTRKKRTRDI